MLLEFFEIVFLHSLQDFRAMKRSLSGCASLASQAPRQLRIINLCLKTHHDNSRLYEGSGGDILCV